MSGANSTPLGRMNPAIGAGKKTTVTGSSLLKPSYLSTLPGGGGGGGAIGSAVAAAAAAAAAATAAINKGNSGPVKRESDYDALLAAEREERKRRRKSRWQGDEKDKTFIPGMPTVLPSNMSKDQEEAYLLQLQIEELSRRLRSNDLGISPNPEDRLALLEVGHVQVTLSLGAGSRHCATGPPQPSSKGWREGIRFYSHFQKLKVSFRSFSLHFMYSGNGLLPSNKVACSPSRD